MFDANFNLNLDDPFGLNKTKKSVKVHIAGFKKTEGNVVIRNGASVLLTGQWIIGGSEKIG